MPSGTPKFELKCPGGHVIPHRTPHGQCTPVHCAVIEGEKPIKKQPLSQRKVAIANAKATFALKREAAIERERARLVEIVKETPLPLPKGGSQEMGADEKLATLAIGSRGAGRKAARLAFLDPLPPPDADDVAINEWVDKRINKNLPMAIAVKEWNLHFGDDDQQEKASDSFLRMAGRHTKDGQLSGGAAIILNLGGLQLPGMPKPSQAIVEGETVDEKK